MSTLCSAWNIFFHFFLHGTTLFTSGSIPFLFFPWIFFFYCFFIISILGNNQKLLCLLFLHYYEIRATICESILKILSIFTFSSDITYETLLHRGFLWNEKKYLIWCRFIFFYLIDKGFCPVREFVSCNKLTRIRRENFGAKVA